MALLALGSVSVANDGTVTKSGECEKVYDLLEAAALLSAADALSTLPTGPRSAARKRAQGRMATAIASYVRDALTTRATAQIPTNASGLQRLPRSSAENTDCNGPGATKTLSII